MHTLLGLLYILYRPDDGPFAAETCGPSQELILKLYHRVDVLSSVLDGNTSI